MDYLKLTFSKRNKKSIHLCTPLAWRYGLAFIIDLDKEYQVNIFFLFLHENICFGFSLEVPQRGTSNEYPQHVFVKNEKNINSFWLIKVPYLEVRIISDMTGVKNR